MSQDKEKILTIAQCYGFINGSFTADQLYDFIVNHNFKFRSTGVDKRAIGSFLSKSYKFRIVKKDYHGVVFEAIDKEVRR